MSRKQEIQAVKALGERIGYGNMMSIASALWANNLKDKYDLPINESSGAFVPVCIFQLKKSEKKRTLESLISMSEHVKEIN